MDHHQFQPVRGRQADRQPARLTRLGVVKVLLNQAIRISEDLNRRFKTQAVFPEIQGVFPFVPLVYHGCIYIV